MNHNVKSPVTKAGKKSPAFMGSKKTITVFKQHADDMWGEKPN